VARLLKALGTLHLERLALFHEYRAITNRLGGWADREERSYFTKEYIVKQAHLCVAQVALLPVQDTLLVLMVAIAANFLKLVRMRVGLDASEEMDATREVMTQYLKWYDYHQGASLRSASSSQH
jgi:hypothetical protein